MQTLLSLCDCYCRLQMCDTHTLCLLCLTVSDNCFKMANTFIADRDNIAKVNSWSKDKMWSFVVTCGLSRHSSALWNSSCLSEGLHHLRPVKNAWVNKGTSYDSVAWMPFLGSILQSRTHNYIHSNVWRLICTRHDVFRAQWESGKSHLLSCNYNQHEFLCSAAGKTEETWLAAELLQFQKKKKLTKYK